MRVKSAVDWWLNLIMWITAAIIVVSLMIIPQKERLIGCVTGVPMLAFLVWIYFGTYYELRDDLLYCRSGPFFERIPYDRIKSAKLSQNLLSSMALSTKHIEIR